MNRLIQAAMAVFVLAFGGPAFADDTVAALRQPALDACISGVGTPEAPALCSCIVDRIIADFGEDAVAMLKILGAGYQPSQEAEIAKLLGLSPADTKVVIARIDDKMTSVMDACLK
ncbi:hypothetical protein sos41_13690 [Alphaproteobacteria bacterium SO-S41]|nr:hypothetical protein sos41_13690 [Alphaproteobacteria bacterium SO-S41]